MRRRPWRRRSKLQQPKPTSLSLASDERTVFDAPTTPPKGGTRWTVWEPVSGTDPGGNKTGTTWRPSGDHVGTMCGPSGERVGTMRGPRGDHWGPWGPRGDQVWPRLLPTWSPTWFRPSSPCVSQAQASGDRVGTNDSNLVPTWFPPGSHAVPTRFPRGPILVPTCPRPVPDPVPTWFPPGPHLAPE